MQRAIKKKKFLPNFLNMHNKYALTKPNSFRHPSSRKRNKKEKKMKSKEGEKKKRKRFFSIWFPLIETTRRLNCKWRQIPATTPKLFSLGVGEAPVE